MTFKKFLKISFSFLAFLLIAILSFFYFWFRSGGLQKAIITEVGKKIINTNQKNSSISNLDNEQLTTEVEVNFIQKYLGFKSPQTHLVLFLNNTELRPAGGFIGTYAVITLDKANPHIVKVEGTEIFDNLAPKNFSSEPPDPIKDYLGIDRFYFRDSNWSPDFSVAATQALELYTKQKGVLADEIDSVVAFTPTLIEELLKLTGPVKVGDLEFTAENFTEKLEYEVEYGFAERGIHFDQRKELLIDLTHNIVKSSAKNLIFHWNDYKNLIEKMLEQKQIIIYSPHNDYQTVFSAKNWAGKMASVEYDYLLWVDANLGALKTDVVIDRILYYSIYKDKNGEYVAKATMRFVHKGKFDWRTTRYRNYARVYVPIGSKLINTEGAMLKDRDTTTRLTDQGIENNRQWFGNFISIEPGETKQLVFEYYVSPSVAQKLKEGDYKLLIQKQLGTNNTNLFVGINFDKNLLFCNPGEKTDKHGDNRYDFNTILMTDLEFEIKTK